MNRKWWSGLAVLGVLLVGCGTSTGAGASTSAAPGVITVVAGENVWGDVIAQIGGDEVAVHSIITDPNTDPHEYESSAADASALATAGLVVVNGLGYDDFLDKLLAASPSSTRRTLTMATALGAGADDNPHLWYETSALPKVADAIVTQLSALDPTHAAAFAARAKTFDSSLDPLTAIIGAIKAKYAGTEIAYTERVPGYLAEAAGLKLGIPASFAQAIEDGDDPSPADIAAFRAALTSHAVRVLLYNAQVTSPATDELKSLAGSNGIPVVGVTETLPATDANFQAWQLRQAKELLSALGG